MMDVSRSLMESGFASRLGLYSLPSKRGEGRAWGISEAGTCVCTLHGSVD